VRPDPGREIQETLIANLPLAGRAGAMSMLRRKGLELVWRQSDEAGPMDELQRAFFLLDRLHPEMPALHRTQFRAQLEAEWRAGRWHGFRRPG
jgi:hypothetical protein